MKRHFYLYFFLTVIFCSVAYAEYSCEGCNVLLITFDSLRADHLGIYGYPRNTSPTIDRLSQEGIVFDDFVLNGASTFISLPSLFTSRNPILKKLTLRNIEQYQSHYYYKIPYYDITSPLIFRLNGYDTWAFSNNYIIETNIFKDFNNVINCETTTETACTTLAIEQFSEKRFMQWIHYASPHFPYSPNFPFNETFFNDSFYDHNFINETIYDAGYYKPTTYPLGKYIADYDGEIRQIDAEIGRIITALDEKGILNRTLIIISSDHGEAMGDFDIYFLHGFLAEPIIRGPLIIWNPKNKERQKISAQIDGVSLFPTIFEILGLNLKYKRNGISFLNLITNKSYEERVAISQGYDPKMKSYSYKDIKLLCYEGGCKLYNVSSHTDIWIRNIEDKKDLPSIFSGMSLNIPKGS